MDLKILSQELNPRQIQGIEALLEERTQKDAAEKVGVSRMTIWRWLKNPVFRQAVIAGRQAQVEGILQKVRERIA